MISIRGLVRNFNPWVPKYMTSKSYGCQVLLLIEVSQNFTGAKHKNSNFNGCQASVAPALTGPLIWVALRPLGSMKKGEVELNRF